jgi:hypothetical protein
MNSTILSICEEYSDNVWYSNCGNDIAPEKIATEIEKQFKIPFLKSVFNHGYVLDTERIIDKRLLVLTLIKSNNENKTLL